MNTHDTTPLAPCTRAMAIRSIRKDAREADFVCSTDAVDSYDSIVEQSWDLRRFTANPVVLYSHNTRELPIGQASNVRVEGGQLRATVRFNDVTQLARDAWSLVADGTLRGISVGFNPKSVRTETRGGRDIMVLSNNELYELSITPQPSNPEALAQLRSRGRGVHSTPARATAALTREECLATFRDPELLHRALAFYGHSAVGAEERHDERDAHGRTFDAQSVRLSDEIDRMLAAEDRQHRSDDEPSLDDDFHAMVRSTVASNATNANTDDGESLVRMLRDAPSSEGPHKSRQSMASDNGQALADQIDAMMGGE